jgi:lysophospholipase L1-like esterase
MFQSIARTLLIPLLALPLGLAPGQGAAQAPAGQAAAPAPLPPATTAVAPGNLARHNGFVEIARAGNIDLLWIGDSITDWWAQPQRGKPVWDEFFASLRPANFGIAGDRTQGVLWRVQNGELEGFSAKLIVLMLGTNNINRNPNLEIAAGNRLIVEEFRRRQPQAKVLVLGVFPRGAAADNPYRASIREINAELAKLADNQNVFYMDIGDRFLAPDGTLPVEIMPDGLHPNENGYRIWAQAVNGRIRELMGL